MELLAVCNSFLGFPLKKSALTQDPFEDAISFQCMGLVEEVEHLQGTREQ